MLAVTIRENSHLTVKHQLRLNLTMITNIEYDTNEDYCECDE